MGTREMEGMVDIKGEMGMGIKMEESREGRRRRIIAGMASSSSRVGRRRSGRGSKWCILGVR